jgi:putative FmdB family regulatory protein
MPLYQFRCKQDECSFEFETLASYDATGVYPTVKCPKCGSLEKSKVITACSFKFGNPVGTDRWCDDYEGHQYRYDYNKEYVAKNREFAEKNSHVGASPYNEINDLADSGLRASPDLFGEVK